MVPLAALWLPILLSTVMVFVASSIMHTLLPYHHGFACPTDRKPLPILALSCGIPTELVGC